MGRLDQFVAQRAFERLEPKLDNRRGAMLFIGAELPELAVHVMQRGLFVTVVESDGERMKRFLEPLAEARLDRQVTWERRPYEMVEFQSSSFSYALAWRGIPDSFPAPALFFKKIKRELKAGGTFFLHHRVKPDPTTAIPLLGRMLARLPEAAQVQVRAGQRRLVDRFCPAGALPAAELLALGEQYLNHEETVGLSFLNDRLELLPFDLAGRLAALLPALVPLLARADNSLLATGPGAALAVDSLFVFARTKELGRVFMMK